MESFIKVIFTLQMTVFIYAIIMNTYLNIVNNINLTSNVKSIYVFVSTVLIIFIYICLLEVCDTKVYIILNVFGYLFLWYKIHYEIHMDYENINVLKLR